MPTLTAASKPISAAATESLAKLLESKLTRTGVDLAALSLLSPVLLVFLRHAGCTFCREALSDLAASRAAIEQSGTRIVVVYLGDEEAMEKVLAHYVLSDLDRIHDVDQSLYEAFGLRQGSLWQVAGPRVWWRGVYAGLFKGHGSGRPRVTSARCRACFCWIVARWFAVFAMPAPVIALSTKPSYGVA